MILVKVKMNKLQIVQQSGVSTMTVRGTNSNLCQMKDMHLEFQKNLDKDVFYRSECEFYMPKLNYESCFCTKISRGFTRRTVFHAPAFQKKGINRLMDIYQIWKPKL